MGISGGVRDHLFEVVDGGFHFGAIGHIIFYSVDEWSHRDAPRVCCKSGIMSEGGRGRETHRYTYSRARCGHVSSLRIHWRHRSFLLLLTSRL